MIYFQKQPQKFFYVCNVIDINYEEIIFNISILQHLLLYK